jgi:hypothetical protein
MPFFFYESILVAVGNVEMLADRLYECLRVSFNSVFFLILIFFIIHIKNNFLKIKNYFNIFSSKKYFKNNFLFSSLLVIFFDFSKVFSIMI